MPVAVPTTVVPPTTELPSPAVKDNMPSQTASDIEQSLSSLAAQLGGTGSAENLQTDFLSAFVQLLQSQAVCIVHFLVILSADSDVFLQIATM